MAPADMDRSIPLRVITHNIRYATEIPFQGEELWEVRRPRLTAELVFNSTLPVTFICLQEVLHSQLLDILEDLDNGTDDATRWAHVGVGRDNGQTAGEYAPIFYRPAVCKLVWYRTVWLSETPNHPSKGWDAASVRIVTIAEFELLETGMKILVMNTHLDDQGVRARREAAKMILELVEKYETSDEGDILPVVLAGDFNSPPEGDAYQLITQRTYSHGKKLSDVASLVPASKRYGNTLTFTSFGYVDPTPSRIDFLFVNKHWGAPPRSHAVLANKFDDGVYSSDHRAVVGDFNLNRRQGLL